MPEVIQIPDCGKTASFEIAHWVSSRLTLANFKATVSLDQELNVLSVWSDDISLYQSQVDLTITIAQPENNEQTKKLLVSISLDAPEKIAEESPEKIAEEFDDAKQEPPALPITQEQNKTLAIPVDELTSQQLFSFIPFTERLR